MSITENVSSAIEPEDRHRVRAIAAAILEHQGFQASELLDLVIDEKTAHLNHRATARAEAAVQLAAIIVNYLREEFEIPGVDHELLQALQREAGL
ncbi:hypothetical protein AVM47_033795 [Pseudomonas aeruginosa]|uniref:hypothetical protein n=1 Tax=Pseudomonas aeruginosa TaxID=287 RepID=UPI00076BCE33|nr:hypothetical protein [Pseudomonas aeruginosa]MBK1802876.1 hypothetical protein [Pseudomonas aeruginosa]MBM2530492.1 hypothetical protein [Pseudomonas aeruginosa]MCA6854741.1 hypothetical protein [Pseudomonas aeruginosa]HCI1729285.1 hypothetical protein [Pseudomonas aeruginosa]HCI1799687.1 hypothetical protein [Pseudomonas aeruginosa]